jgi:hypothetical protein
MSKNVKAPVLADVGYCADSIVYSSSLEKAVVFVTRTQSQKGWMPSL